MISATWSRHYPIAFDANLFRRLIQMQSRCIDETVREAAS